MEPAELAEAVRAAVEAAVRVGDLHVEVPAPAQISRSRLPGHGDYSTNIALRLAGPSGRPAQEVAALLARDLRGTHGIAAVEVAGPGFLNITLAATGETAVAILAAGADYGRSREPSGLRRGVLSTAPRREGLLSLREARLQQAMGSLDRVLDMAGAQAGGAEVESPAGQPVHLVGRASNWADLVAAVGEDVARYTLARSPLGSVLRIDPDQVARRTPGNPAFDVFFALARTASIGRAARALGVEPATEPAPPTEAAEIGLLLALGEFPHRVALAARLREPYRIARYLEELAAAYQDFHDGCRLLPRGDEGPSDVHRARLTLNDATAVVLTNGLALLGVTAEPMNSDDRNKQ